MTGGFCSRGRPAWIATIGEALLAVLAATHLAALALLAAGLDLGPVPVVLAAAAAVGAAGAVCFLRLAPGRAAVALGATLLVVTFAMSIAARFYDVSFDGQAYHQGAVLALGRGWNPLNEPFSAALVWGAGTDFGTAIWIQHYPKAAWLIGAVLHQVTGSLQAAKGMNLIAAAAAFGVVYGVAGRLGIGAVYATAVAVAAAANPVTSAQALSFYNDGLAASMLTILAAGLVALVWSNERRDLVAPALAIPIVVNLKFSIFVIAVVICAGAAAALLFRHRWRATGTVGTLAAVGLASVILVGWAPYVQNMLAHGHPFHPLLGPGAVEIVDENIPTAFKGHGPLWQFAHGILGTTNNGLGVVPEISAPFAFGLQEVRAAGRVDVHIGGFGVLFSTVTLVTLVTLLALLCRPSPSRAWLVAGLAVLGISVAIHPENWWARYVPQLWLGPVALAAAALAARSTVTRSLGLALLAAILLDAAITAGSAAHVSFWRTRQMAAEHDHIARDFDGAVQASVGPFVGSWYRLIEQGFNVDLVADPERLACETPEALSITYGLGLYCPASGTN